MQQRRSGAPAFTAAFASEGADSTGARVTVEFACLHRRTAVIAQVDLALVLASAVGPLAGRSQPTERMRRHDWGATLGVAQKQQPDQRIRRARTRLLSDNLSHERDESTVTGFAALRMPSSRVAQRAMRPAGRWRCFPTERPVASTRGSPAGAPEAGVRPPVTDPHGTGGRGVPRTARAAELVAVLLGRPGPALGESPERLHGPRRASSQSDGETVGAGHEHAWRLDPRSLVLGIRTDRIEAP